MSAEHNTSARWKLRTRLSATPPPGQRRRRGIFVETQPQIDSSAPSGRPLRGARADDAAPTELENLLAGGFYKDVAPTVPGQTHLKRGGTGRAATSSAASSGATNTVRCPPRRTPHGPPAGRGLVLSQRDKTHHGRGDSLLPSTRALCNLSSSTRTMFTSTRSPPARVRKLAAHFTNQASRRLGQDH